MKQYWRVGTIRAIVGVLLGMLVLGRYYYKFIPFFNSLHPSILGAILLAGMLLLIFLFIGYLYDAKYKLWNENIQITTEKNPFQYVPQPRLFQTEYPAFFAIFDTIRRILKKRNIDTTRIDEYIQYLDDYFKLRPDRREDLFESEGVASNFMFDHSFIEAPKENIKPGIRSRIKKGFQLHVWRLNWVQSFTGLAQDVLVFASLYIVVLFPDAVIETGGVSFNYLLLGILVISMPLYFGLLIGGYYYDKKLRVWSPDSVVKIERTPYSYVPSPRMKIFTLPFFYAMLSFYYNSFIELGLDTSELRRMVEYLDTYSTLRAEKISNIDYAKKMRSEYGVIFNTKREGD